MSQSEHFAIEQQPSEGGSAKLVISGELDLATSPELESELERLAARETPTLLDLSGVSFIDSTGLAVLLRASDESRRNGWSLVLAGSLQRPVARLFDLTGVWGRLPLPDAPPRHIDA